MNKLFLLKPEFLDEKLGKEGQRYYCPSCSSVEGVLSYYPALRGKLEIIYVDFKKPRHSIVTLLGEENQGCPVLVLDAKEATANMEGVKMYNDQRFINELPRILQHLAKQYNIGQPHP